MLLSLNCTPQKHKCAGMTQLTVAALQLALASPDPADNIAAVAAQVEAAAAQGAQVILPPELFAGPYFCVTEDEARFALAHTLEEDASVKAMQRLAKALGVAIPTSFFEREGPHYYNTLAMIDAQGEIMGIYRKSHIPDGPGYEEKYYFRPGNTGFKVWDVFGTRIGVGVCWDQWYPECARAMALMGAKFCSTPPPSAANPMTPISTPAGSGAAQCSAMPRPTACRSLRPTASASRKTGRPSMATASSPTSGAISWPSMALRKPAFWSPRSIWKKPPATAPAWASSAIAARNSMAASRKTSERCIAT
jgi:predicted amidohydrolase